MKENFFSKRFPHSIVSNYFYEANFPFTETDEISTLMEISANSPITS
jgi:hypothetical protein